MAKTTGAANGLNDFLERVVTFLTTGLGDSDNWELILRDTSVANTRYIYLRAKGLSGDKNIYTQIKTYFDENSAIYTWSLRGATTFNDENGSITGQELFGSITNDSSPPSFAPMSGVDIQYWVWANAQRCIVAYEIGGRYYTLYFGFYIPYGTPSEVPYPYYVSAISQYGSVTPATPSTSTVSSSWSPSQKGASLYGYDGEWCYISNVATDDRFVRTNSHGYIWPHVTGSSTVLKGVRPCVGGARAIYPSVIVGTNGVSDYVAGELDGIYSVSGYHGISPQDIISINGDDYFVVNNTGRNGSNDYAAIRDL